MPENHFWLNQIVTVVKQYTVVIFLPNCSSHHCNYLIVVLSFVAPLASRCYSHAKAETDEEFDARWVTYFNKPDIDAWELRKGMRLKLVPTTFQQQPVVRFQTLCINRNSLLSRKVKLNVAIKKSTDMSVNRLFLIVLKLLWKHHTTF